MATLISTESRKVRLDRRPRVTIVRRRRASPSIGEASRSICRAGWRVARWCKKLAFFFLPPAVYHVLKWVMPRVMQAPTRRQLGDALARRLESWRRPHPSPAATTWTEATAPAEAPAKAVAPPEIPAEHLDAIARYHALHQMSENSPALLEAKNQAASQIYRHQLYDRARLLRELARLAELCGQELLACAYRVRAIRLLGADACHDLPLVRRTLQRLDFGAEAEALAAMYEDPALAPERCQSLLEAALAGHRRPPTPVAFERFEDRRHPEVPRVAVIVSLYNAADKLPLFLNALRSQTLHHTRQLEFIFIDSGSPADEYGALTRTLVDFTVPFLYVRTARRETIQTAWNRGIALARAPYLSFLGVDESVTADALEVLADALDADPSLDWVEGDSLLTQVDKSGCWVRDIMTYDRDGYTPNHVSLETCYLSWVGAMYRRSIHERFGYYDGSFRACGDNEFKGRLLPFLKTHRIPRLLGVFLNYPEARASASPVAELEDIRAWYLHRTLGGVRYTMKHRDPCEVERLLLLSLHYRKSYTTHISSDVEYASHVARHLSERLPNSPLLGLAPGIDRLLESVRSHDYIECCTPRGFMSTLGEARKIWADVQSEHRSGPWLKQAVYDIGRDNRHEQHAFLY
jgi:glycosyltransferase involved in cell wall biosynthesis